MTFFKNGYTHFIYSIKNREMRLWQSFEICDETGIFNGDGKVNFEEMGPVFILVYGGVRCKQCFDDFSLF